MPWRLSVVLVDMPWWVVLAAGFAVLVAADLVAHGLIAVVAG